ncbi:hypothetical protein D3C76_772150 [compost metagenome]
MFVGVVADGEQVALAVVQEAEVHAGQRFNAAGKGVCLGDALAGNRLDVSHRRALGGRPLVCVELCKLAPGQQPLGGLIVARGQLQPLQFATQVHTLRMQGIQPERPVFSSFCLLRKGRWLCDQRLQLFGQPRQQRGGHVAHLSMSVPYLFAQGLDRLGVSVCAGIGVQQRIEGVKQPLGNAPVCLGRVGHFQQAGPECQQQGGEVAAVHARDIQR